MFFLKKQTFCVKLTFDDERVSRAALVLDIGHHSQHFHVNGECEKFNNEKFNNEKNGNTNHVQHLRN